MWLMRGISAAFAGAKLQHFFELTKENERKVRISLSSRLFRPMFLQKPREGRWKREEALFLQDVCKGYARRSHKYMDTFASL